MFMSVYIVCRVASQGWGRMILYLWSFYSRSYFANYYSVLPSVNIHRSPRHQPHYRLQKGSRSEVGDTRERERERPRQPSLASVHCVQRNPQYKDLCVEVSGGHREPRLAPTAFTMQQSIRQSISPQSMTSSNFLWYSCSIIKSHSIEPGAEMLGNSSFYCGPCCYLSRLPVTRRPQTEPEFWLDTTCLTPHTRPGELWPSWNLSGSDWHFRHMDGLTPTKIGPE